MNMSPRKSPLGRDEDLQAFISRIPHFEENTFLKGIFKSGFCTYRQKETVYELSVILKLLGTGDDFKSRVALGLWRDGLKGASFHQKKELLHKIRLLDFEPTDFFLENIDFHKVKIWLDGYSYENLSSITLKIPRTMFRDIFLKDLEGSKSPKFMGQYMIDSTNTHFRISGKSIEKEQIAKEQTSKEEKKDKMPHITISDQSSDQEEKKSAKTIAKNIGSSLAEGAKEGAVLAAANEFNKSLVSIFSQILIDKFGVEEKTLKSENAQTLLMLLVPSLVIVISEFIGDSIPHGDKIQYAAEKALVAVSQEKISELLAPVMAQLLSLINDNEILFSNHKPAGELTEPKEDLLEKATKAQKSSVAT